MSNITNTCIYQSYTNITNIASQDTCLHQVPTCTMHHASNCVPQPVPSEKTMHQQMFNHQPCIPSTNHVPYHLSTMYINTCTIPCTIYHIPWNVSQPYTISCHTPYTNKPRYEPIIYLTKYTSTNMYHTSNDVPQLIKQISQTHASSMVLNITNMQPHNTI
jgi:hypothetical protein